MLFSALLPISDHHTSSRALKIVMRCVLALVLLALGAALFPLVRLPSRQAD